MAVREPVYTGKMSRPLPYSQSVWTSAAYSLFHPLHYMHRLNEGYSFHQTSTYVQTHNRRSSLHGVPRHLHSPPSPPPPPLSLMRTGPCVFDPAASSQPRGPSASCLFNNPHRRSSCSPTALSTIWIQIKSTPVWFFGVFQSKSRRKLRLPGYVLELLYLYVHMVFLQKPASKVSSTGLCAGRRPADQQPHGPCYPWVQMPVARHARGVCGLSRHGPLRNPREEQCHIHQSENQTHQRNQQCHRHRG